MRNSTFISGPKLVIILFTVLVSGLAYSQDDPVYDPFGSTMLIDQQTNVIPYAGSKEILIHHRFGQIKELTDLFGIYAPSNIRMGINYAITENIMLGFGTEKNSKMQDFHAKWNVLNQTQSGSMPFSVTLYGNMGIDATNEEAFGINYKFTNRFSYFSQVILARKFNDRFSLLIAPGFAHFNAVDSTMLHDQVCLSIGGRVKVYNEISILFEYDDSFSTNTYRSYQEDSKPLPNVGLGLEINTGTHSFQVFAAPFDKITPQKNYVFNKNDFLDGGMRFGFNITVRL
jgi:hypothetical protein